VVDAMTRLSSTTKTTEIKLGSTLRSALTKVRLSAEGLDDQTGFGIETLDWIRSGAFDRAVARAFAGELKTVAEYPCVRSVLARVEANDMFKKLVPSAHPLQLNFADVRKFSVFMVNRRLPSLANLTILTMSR
jgi:hypothetical protein